MRIRINMRIIIRRNITHQVLLFTLIAVKLSNEITYGFSTNSHTIKSYPDDIHRRIVASTLTSTSIHPLSMTATSINSDSTTVNENQDRHLPIDESFEGLSKIHSNPDIFIITDFLDKGSCRDLIEKAEVKKLDLSPVAYAGKTNDKSELIGLAAKGPVVWASVLSAWYQLSQSSGGDGGSSLVQLGIQTLENYALFFIIAFVSITAFIEFRADELQTLRTSTSTTLDNLDDPKSGTVRFVTQAANLFNPNQNDKLNPAKHAQYFESPTVIRYEKDQVLAPHFDANKAASTEDVNRGGQTLATLLVYLNDVENGGNTRFGRLVAEKEETNISNSGSPLTVKPKMGDALLFFPADKDGTFDERLEHEGCLAVDTKWIARIWRHIDRVPPPFGLSNGALSKL